MKLLRYGPAGAEKPGVLDRHGRIRDLSALLPDLTPEWLAPERLAALRAIDVERLALVEGNPRMGVPVAGIRQFVAIGLNYRQHAAEAGMAVPQQPIVFTKAITSMSGADDDIVLPPGSGQTDWEVELGLVIGRTCRSVPPGQALDHVAGYLVANDVSERDWQIRQGGQWVKGKSFDTFGPIGPWLVTADEVPDPQRLDLELSVNGEVMQRGSTADMIFPVTEIVSYCSRFMTLLPGDVIITGTPAGVGMGMKPPRFLRRGDVVRLTIGGLGTQTQRVA